MGEWESVVELSYMMCVVHSLVAFGSVIVLLKFGLRVTFVELLPVCSCGIVYNCAKRIVVGCFVARSESP